MQKPPDNAPVEQKLEYAISNLEYLLCSIRAGIGPVLGLTEAAHELEALAKEIWANHETGGSNVGS